MELCALSEDRPEGSASLGRSLGTSRLVSVCSACWVRTPLRARGSHGNQYLAHLDAGEPSPARARRTRTRTLHPPAVSVRALFNSCRDEPRERRSHPVGLHRRDAAPGPGGERLERDRRRPRARIRRASCPSTRRRCPTAMAPSRCRWRLSLPRPLRSS